MTGLLGLLIIVAIAIFYGISLFNNLVRLRNQVKNAFSQIDVQLVRRYELIPNLVETAKGYIKHERETLEAVIKARQNAMTAHTGIQANPTGQPMKDFVGAEAILTQSMGRLLAVAESYPDLKANQTMGQLMEELSSTENKVAFSRQAYNDSVLEYNNARETFPSSAVAGSFNFQKAEPFEVTNPTQREAVKVQF